jgi:hypothetical protein
MFLLPRGVADHPIQEAKKNKWDEYFKKLVASRYSVDDTTAKVCESDAGCPGLSLQGSFPRQTARARRCDHLGTAHIHAQRTRPTRKGEHTRAMAGTAVLRGQVISQHRCQQMAGRPG